MKGALRVWNFWVCSFCVCSLLVSGTVACSKQSKPVEEVWSPASGKPSPVIDNKTQFGSQDMSLLLGQERIERSTQRIGKAKVVGTFLQQIRNQKGDLVFLKTRYQNGDFIAHEKKSEKLFTNRFAFLEKLKKSQPELKTAKEVFAPEVILTADSGASQLAYQIDYIDQNQTAVYRLQISPSGRVLTRTIASSGFEQGRGTVFPAGPKQSELAVVPLANLIGDGSLSKNSLKLTTQVSEKAQNPDLIFDYDTQDVRFDQVQVFYYVDQALQFFQSRLGVTLPFGLEVQTHFGFPEKTNAAFYYPGQIRLNNGDGVHYQNIMKDPSIVFHEASHAVVDALAKLPLGQGEGGSLNEAFADFFTAVHFKNPNMGEVAFMKGPFKRTLANNHNLQQKNGGLYNDSLIVSGLFWDIKNTLNEDKALQIASKTLVRLGPNGNFANLSAAIDAALENGFTEADKKLVHEQLLKRGFR